MTCPLGHDNLRSVNLIDPDDHTRKWEITITDDGRITKMTEQQQQEEIGKLREGTAKWLYEQLGGENWESVPLKRPIGKGSYLQDYQQHFLNQADSLLRTVLSDLKIDTGELTDVEITKAFVEGYHSRSRYPAGLPKEFCGRRAVAEAARAKFKSIGELIE